MRSRDSQERAASAGGSSDEPAKDNDSGKRLFAGRFGDLVVFVVPVLLPVEFAVGGRLFLPEIMLLITLPFVVYEARQRHALKVSRWFVGLALLWLGGLILTDIYRGTPYADYSRGWSRIGFFVLNFIALYLLIDGRWRRVFLFGWGMVLGMLFVYVFNPDTFAEGDPWKFGYGSAITLAGVLLASSGPVYRRPAVSITLVGALGILNFFEGFRSLAGVCLLSVGLVGVAVHSNHLTRRGRSPLEPATVVLVTAVTAIIVIGAYSVSAAHGLLGSTAEQKYGAQGGALGVLISARAENIASVRAILDSPVLGHGSWAKDPKYLRDLKRVLEERGLSVPPYLLRSPLIPTHSHLFGSWVEAGVLGGVFWLWCLVLVGSIVPRLHRLGDGRIVFVSFLSLALTWDVLFSPFGAERRFTVAYYLIVLLLALQAIQRRDDLPKLRPAGNGSGSRSSK